MLLVSIQYLSKIYLKLFSSKYIYIYIWNFFIFKESKKLIYLIFNCFFLHFCQAAFPSSHSQVCISWLMSSDYLYKFRNRFFHDIKLRFTVSSGVSRKTFHRGQIIILKKLLINNYFINAFFNLSEIQYSLIGM